MVLKRNHYISVDLMFSLLILALVSALLGLVLPFSILIIFDRVLPNQATTTLWFLYVIIVASIIADTKLKAFEERLTAKVTQRFEKELTGQVFRAICLANLAQYKKLETGEYLERIRTIPALRNYFSGDTMRAGVNFVTCLIIWSIIALINPKAGLILIVASAALFCVSYSLSKKKVEKLEVKSTLEGNTSSKIIEIVSHPLNLKSASMEFRMENFMDEAVNEREDRSIELEKLESILPLVMEFTQQVSLACVVVASAVSVINLDMSQGGMAAIILLTNRYFAPYRQIMGALSMWSVNKMQLARLKEVLALEEGGHDDQTTKGEDTFLPKKIIVTGDKSQHFKRGNIYVLQGGSGSGKSHIGQCITLEANDPKLSISVNGQDIGEYNYGVWKGMVASVDTHSSFIEGTIIENITCFRPKLYKAAYALCDAMDIKDIIDGLPRGFYTELKGTKNYPFSRQVHFSLLIIRALLCQKPVLIIDDIDLIYDSGFEVNLMRCLESRSNSMICFLMSNKINIQSGRVSKVPVSRMISQSVTLEGAA